jgi:Leucine-rich repeat (LRR) protein
LRELYAGGSPFVYYGLQQLNRLKHLEVLDASHQEMNDGAIEGFENCRSLKHLNVSGGKVTSNGLRLLAKLKQLEELNLGGSPLIDDSGLAALRQHRQLKKLNLDGTRCTPAGVQALKKQLKDTEIRYAGMTL